MKNKKIFYFVCAVLLCGAGCSLLESPQYSEPAFYDLASQSEPAPLAAPPVEFRSFADATGNGLLLMTRISDGRVVPDDLNRFSAPPVQLIRRRLIESFGPPSGETIKVNGLLCRFEMDLRDGKAVMIMDYLFQYSGTRKTVRHRIKVKAAGTSARHAVMALEKAVSRSAQRLAGELSLFKKQCVINKEKK